MFMFFPYHLLGLADQLDLFANLQTFVLLLATSFHIFLQSSALFCVFMRFSASFWFPLGFCMPFCDLLRLSAAALHFSINIPCP